MLAKDRPRCGPAGTPLLIHTAEGARTGLQPGGPLAPFCWASRDHPDDSAAGLLARGKTERDTRSDICFLPVIYPCSVQKNFEFVNPPVVELTGCLRNQDHPPPRERPVSFTGRAQSREDKCWRRHLSGALKVTKGSDMSPCPLHLAGTCSPWVVCDFRCLQLGSGMSIYCVLTLYLILKLQIKK